MELKDYSIEELKAEIKRRKKEDKKMQPKREPEYGYITATVTAIDGDVFTRQSYRLEIDEDCKSKVTSDFLCHSRHHRFNLLSGVFSKKTAPEVGDKVMLKSLKTKANPTGYGLYSDPKICKVVED